MKRSTVRRQAVLRAAAVSIIAVLAAVSCVSPRLRTKAFASAPPSKAMSLGDPLPVDPAVLKGTLPNGLVYYIRRNGTPQKRAELRLVVNAGSVLEDDDQKGLAHFLEHMAFNGTREFPKQAIVDYLESIGMRFGPDLNAYTSYDETVYQLQVPTDREDALPTALRILEQWAHAMTLDEDEIDKERGVVLEEWRMRRDAESRIRDLQAPVLFHRSRYAERVPIGDPETIRTFHPEVLRRYYRDWYRPDLMAVIAVGDFEPLALERLVKERFGALSGPERPRERKTFPVPLHGRTLFSVVADPEASRSRVRLMTLHPPAREETVGDYRRMLVESLVHRMLSARLEEISRGPDSPFVSAYAGGGRWVRSMEVFVLGAEVQDGGIAHGLARLAVEAERARRHGFTASELERQKSQLMSTIERAYNERDTEDSADYADEYARNFLDGEAIPGIEHERELFRTLLPGIALGETTDLVRRRLSSRSRVVLASSPEKEGVRVPSERELRAALKVRTRSLAPYRDRVSDQPLLPETPSPGVVVETETVDALGIEVWSLSNGATVVLKPTDFKKDEVLFEAYAAGGYSLASESEIVAAKTAAEVVAEGGLGGFDRTELGKKLAGKIVEVSPWIDELYQGLSGSSSSGDLETLFQLVHLSFTSPREDRQAFSVYRDRLKAQLANREASPEQVFWDSVQSALTGNNPWAAPLRSDMLDRMDPDASMRLYRELFGDAEDFTFFLVGSFAPETIRPLVERYIASLPGAGPSGGRVRRWRDLGIRAPSGVVTHEVKKGIDPKSSAAIVFNGPFDWSLENVVELRALGDILEIPLRETLREKLGGTYDVSVFTVPSKHPVSAYRVYVLFGTAPDMVGSMMNALFEVIGGIRERGPDRTAVDKVKEILRRERETNLRRNEFWLGILRSYSMNGVDFRDILRYDTLIAGLTPDSAREAALRYLDTGRFVQVVLYPEGWRGEEPVGKKESRGEPGAGSAGAREPVAPVARLPELEPAAR